MTTIRIFDHISISSSSNEKCFEQTLFRISHILQSIIFSAIVTFIRNVETKLQSRTSHRRQYHTARAHCMLDY